MDVRTKGLLAFSLILPLLALMLLSLQKKIHYERGHELVFPIQGYDPRDLLSGHYLRFSVDYGNSLDCGAIAGEAYLCLADGFLRSVWVDDCLLQIKGECRGARFLAGIERFYVPQEDALTLETLIRDNSASILVAVDPGGKAMIKELMIDELPWKEFLARAKEQKAEGVNPDSGDESDQKPRESR